ncbi:MAG: class I SAM-dependent methyltransferase [Bacteroidia bacterium]
MAEKENEWFKNWFNTPYYHLLYKKRDETEAANFLDLLIEYLSPKENSKFLDLACGKGRHSIYLNNKGYNVVGTDLSPNSIECAKKYSSKTIQFIEHDMREPLTNYEFDFIVNLFTSFGYFKNQEDDKSVIKNVKRCLKPEGTFILDYFNPAKPNPHFDIPFTKIIDSVKFEIMKHAIDGRIIKQIKVTDADKEFLFTEQVRIYSLDQFKQILNEGGLTLVQTFGNYNLEPYEPLTSERLILIAKN